jgi:hypothetical protein
MLRLFENEITPDRAKRIKILDTVSIRRSRKSPMSWRDIDSAAALAFGMRLDISSRKLATRARAGLLNCRMCS